MKTHLKIKIKSLAHEAHIIRREEHRWFKKTGEKAIYDEKGNLVRMKNLYRKDHPLRMDLQAHRINEVRPECRCALIAYGYLRGRSYKHIENKCHEPPNWERVAALIWKFGPFKSGEDRKKIADDLKTWSEVIPNT